MKTFYAALPGLARTNNRGTPQYTTSRTKMRLEMVDAVNELALKVGKATVCAGLVAALFMNPGAVQVCARALLCHSRH